MAQTADQQMELADVYAAALFSLATDATAVAAVRTELEELVQLMDTQPDFALFLASSAVDDDARCDSLERMFRGKLSDIVVDTLQVMNQHNRVHLLKPLLRSYALRQEHAAGEVEVIATSAVELDERQRAEIQKLAAELSGKRPLVEYVVDPGVIGGLILRVGDYRFDNSLRRHLYTARRQLLERSERGLEVGKSSA